MNGADGQVPSKAEIADAASALDAVRELVSQLERAGAHAQAQAAGEKSPDQNSNAEAKAADGSDDGNKRLPKKKYAIFLAYNGHGYSGMQINPNVPTIEATLRDALVKAGGISQDNADKLASLKWSRSARTDKGVSALGQVVALKLMQPPDVLRKLQAALPPKIKAFGIRKVTMGFDARAHCESRVYEYSFPEWAFDPDLFPLSPSWRPASHPHSGAVIHSDDASAKQAAQEVSGLADGTRVLLREGYSLTQPPPKSAFVFDDECRDRLTSILKRYEGCHNFHNFTPNVTPEQMSAQRNMLSFECHGVFAVRKANGGEARWVRTRVHGQSFLLNQIRKMVGLAIAVYRGTAPDDAIHRALDPCLDFSTPMAPELGLFLCECKFATYNERFGNDRVRLDLNDWQDEVETFKQEHIYPALARRDEAEAVNYQWLQTVTDERYMFSTWHEAAPVRKLKRPRPREALADAEDADQ